MTDPEWSGTDPEWNGTDPEWNGTDPERDVTDSEWSGTDPESSVADPDGAKRALAALAEGTVSQVTDEVVISLAAFHLRDIERAATFVDRGGYDRLVLAIDRVEADGLDGLTQRGKRTLIALDQLSATVCGPLPDRSEYRSEYRSDALIRRDDPIEPAEFPRDHVHSAHATDLTADRQRIDR